MEMSFPRHRSSLRFGFFQGYRNDCDVCPPGTQASRRRAALPRRPPSPALGPRAPNHSLRLRRSGQGWQDTRGYSSVRHITFSVDIDGCHSGSTIQLQVDGLSIWNSIWGAGPKC